VFLLRTPCSVYILCRYRRISYSTCRSGLDRFPVHPYLIAVHSIIQIGLMLDNGVEHAQCGISEQLKACLWLPYTVQFAM
jgi:hypothetical protein